jgi:hypothetical protein
LRDELLTTPELNKSHAKIPNWPSHPQSCDGPYGQDPSAYRSARLQDGAEPPGSDGRGWLDRLADPDPDEVV